MEKQLEEQVDILRTHMQGVEIDPEFVAVHARHLFEVAEALRSDSKWAAIANRRKEFLHAISG